MAQQLVAAVCGGWNLTHFVQVAKRSSGARRLAAGVLAMVNLAFLTSSLVSLVEWRLADGVPEPLQLGVATATLGATASISALILRQRLHRRR